MSTISTKGKHWFLTASLAAFLGLALATGLYLKVLASTERSAALFSEIAKGERRIRSGVALQALARDTVPLQSALETRLIHQGGAADFIEKLEATGRNIGILVVTDSVEPHALSLPQMEEIRVALHGTGAWEKVVRYLALIEELPVESRVLSAVLSRTGKGVEELWRVDVVLSALQKQ